jgi:cob(I)alamin adenosyltransferase
VSREVRVTEKGAIHVYTGNGKGKTTAALGLAWRALGRGSKVCMVQFMKAPNTCGEQSFADTLAPMFAIRPMGRKGFIGNRPLEPEDISCAEAALASARDAMLSGEYDVIILDEANVAVHKRLLGLEMLLALIADKPNEIVLVVTGRNAHPDVIDCADVAVEIKKIKHHFDKGVRAVKGIDY